MRNQLKAYEDKIKTQNEEIFNKDEQIVQLRTENMGAQERLKTKSEEVQISL